MRKRIKNLKYDPLHADKPMRGWGHLEYLDNVMTLEQAEITIAYESRMKKTKTIEIVKQEISNTKKRVERNASNG